MATSDPKIFRSVLLSRVRAGSGLPDGYIVATGMEPDGESLSLEGRFIRGSIRNVLGFIGALPEGSKALIGRDWLHVESGHLRPVIQEERLEGQSIEVWVNATKAGLEEILLKLPAISQANDR